MTNSTSSATINIDLPDVASGSVQFILVGLGVNAASEVFPPQSEYIADLDADGEATDTLPTPDATGDASWTWLVVKWTAAGATGTPTKCGLISFGYSASAQELGALLEASAESIATSQTGVSVAEATWLTLALEANATPEDWTTAAEVAAAYLPLTGGTLSDALTIDPDAGVASGILEVDAPASSTSTYTFRFTRNGSPVFFLRDDGILNLNGTLVMGANHTISSGSSGADLRFPTGGGEGTGNINIDTSESNGLIKAVEFTLPGGGKGLRWARGSIDGTAQTVIQNGSGDVTAVLSGTFTLVDSAGNVAGGTINATQPGANFNLYDDGGTNTCQLQVAADGSVAVQRTNGSRTYTVNLDLNWI